MTKKTHTLTSPERVEYDERLAHMIHDRANGMTWTALAVQYGYKSPGNAQRAARKYLEDIRSDATEEYREIINLRLEMLFNAYWQQALNGNLQAAYFIRDLLIQMGKANGVGQIKVEQTNTETHNTLIIIPDKSQLPAHIAEVIDNEPD